MTVTLYVMAASYVDNLLITAPDDRTVAKARKTLMDKFTMTDFRGATPILRIDIIQEKKCGTVNIIQVPNVLSLSKENTIEYQSIVGSLIFVCRFMKKSTSVHMETIKRT